MATIDDRNAPLAAAVAKLWASLQQHAVASTDGADAASCCRAMQREVLRFGALAGAAGASGLAHCAEWLSANLEYLAQLERGLSADERRTILRWPTLVTGYVSGPGSLNAAASALVGFAELPLWLLKPSSVGRANIFAKLAAYQSGERMPAQGASPLAAPPIAARPLPSSEVSSAAPVAEALVAPIARTAAAPVASPAAEPIAEAAASANAERSAAAYPGMAAPPVDGLVGLSLDEEVVLPVDAMADRSVATTFAPVPAGSAEAPHAAATWLPSGKFDGLAIQAALAQSTAEATALPACTLSSGASAGPSAQRAQLSLDAALALLVGNADELATSSAAVRPGALARYGEALLAVTDAAQDADALGLAEACGLLHERTGAARLLPEAAAQEPPAWLLPALDFALVAQTLAATPDDAELAASLLECLRHPAWPSALPEAETQALRALLGLPETAPAEPGATVAGEARCEDNEEAGFAAAHATQFDGGSQTQPEALPDTVPAGTAPARAPLRGELDLPDQQRIDPEHLALLATEFPAMLAAACAELAAARNDAMSLESCAEVLDRGGNASQAAGLVALHCVLEHVAQRLRCAQGEMNDAQLAWLADLSQRVGAYLEAPMDPSAAAALVGALHEGGPWMAPEPAHAAMLERALPRVVLAADTSAPERTREATAELVSLAIPADINPELLEGLAAELPVQSADFAAAMQRLASGAASMFDLEVAKRAAHTLKGAANTVGVQGIANLTHHVEDILIALTRHGRMPSHGLAEALVAASDCLEAMSEAVLGAGPAPHDARATLQQVLDWANRIDAEGLPESDEAPAATDAAGTRRAPEGAQEAERGAAAAVQPGAPESTPESMLRLPASLVDELLRLVGETMIANTQIKEQLRLSVEHTRAVTKQNTTLQELAGELEQLVDVRGVTTPLGVTKGNTDFDALEFDHFNELHTVTRRLIEAATDSRELSLAGEQRLATLADLLDGQGRLATENQAVVMKTRMVPAASIVSRLQRSVRQTARALDKRIELRVAGAGTAIDSQVLNALLDPLMHLLRNAADHGIESPDLRAQRGKPAVGRIELAFAREGTSVVVRVSDDGAGLDMARIRAKAASLGHLSAAKPLGDEDAARLILLPGFSTRDDATQVSGRGIGMDAVNTKVQALKGTLRLASPPGRGLTVELRLPASLMTAHGLLVRQNDQVLAISSYGIHDIRYVTRDQVRVLGNAQIVHDEDKVYELERLDALIGRKAHDDERGWFPALLVQTDSGQLRAVRVQEVLDCQEVVVKGLGRYVPRPQGLVGVTILGDGGIAPVLDLPQLLRAPQDAARISAALPASGEAAQRSPVEAHRSALVVDDSLSARRATAQFMRDAGFVVRTAIDGIEAAALVEKQVPDVILVDMEMPRMNGLELTTHLRARAATQHVPIVMITSRSTEKHRRQAQAAGVNAYLTKPFADDELLEHVERLTGAAALV